MPEPLDFEQPLLALEARLAEFRARDDLRDGIVPESPGGAHRDWEEASGHLRAAIRDALAALRGLSPEALREARCQRFWRIGVVAESSGARHSPRR